MRRSQGSRFLLLFSYTSPRSHVYAHTCKRATGEWKHSLEILYWNDEQTNEINDLEKEKKENKSIETRRLGLGIVTET